MKDWIAIFRTGRHTDSAGNTQDWTEQDLDKIVSTYAPAKHEAPVVIGHPKDNAPAYAWVEGLKREGDTLWMKMKDVVPAFADMVMQKMFKKRSISLYPDGSLRHVGWLGAQPPAVKGLPDFAFGDDGGAVIEFEESNAEPRKEDVQMNFWERLKKKLEGANISFKELFGSDEPPVLYTEADIKTKIETAVAAAVTAKQAEFSEAAKQKDAEFKSREEALRKKEADAKKAGVASFTEGLQTKGILTPAMEKLGMGVTAFMQAIAESGTTVEFGEADDKGAKPSQTPLEFAQAFLAALPPSITFGEVAGRGKETGTGSAADKIEALVKEKLKADKALTYGAAFTEVQHENPELAAEYADEIAG
ncbi:MAG: hypothetical protein HZA15_15470 [Nitrospirae bacterium]|nr:hypothetical protein [Nitrospirota bacterium]